MVKICCFTACKDASIVRKCFLVGNETLTTQQDITITTAQPTSIDPIKTEITKLFEEYYQLGDDFFIQEQYLIRNLTILDQTYKAISENILTVMSDPNASAYEKESAQLIGSQLNISSSQPPVRRKKRQVEEETNNLPQKSLFAGIYWDLKNSREDTQNYLMERRQNSSQTARKLITFTEFPSSSVISSNSFKNLSAKVADALNTLLNIKKTEEKSQEIIIHKLGRLDLIIDQDGVDKRCGEKFKLIIVNNF